jgi:hypothetical protein
VSVVVMEISEKGAAHQLLITTQCRVFCKIFAKATSSPAAAHDLRRLLFKHQQS